MKAIYVRIGKNVYKVKQNTAIPTSLTFRTPGVSSSLNVDSYNKAVTQNVYINNLKKPGTKSNAELYRELVDYLKTEQITEIQEIQNYFKIYVDYTAYENGREIDRASVVRPIKPLDKAYMLGVATNNECVYRRVKTFNPSIEFKMNNTLPHGIMSTQKTGYALKINNIAIFQDFSVEPEIHESTYEVSYGIGSSTIQSNLDNMKMIYSTQNEGIDIQEISLSFVPRTIEIAMDIILADYIVAYNDNNITQILLENIEAKYPPEEDPPIAPDEPEDPGIIPDPDDKPIADGDYTPDEEGYFSYYERCTETTPGALLVVEDLISDNLYNVDTMIKKSMVIADIDDIEVGEFVIFREALDGFI